MVMIKFLVLLGFFCFFIKTGCGQNLMEGQVESTPTPETSTFDFNKTIEDIILSQQNAEEINKLLEQIIGFQNQTRTSKFLPTVDTANLAVATASLAVSSAALGIQAAQFEMDRQKNIKDADDKQKREVIEDEHYENLTKQNELIIQNLEKINSGIKDAADQISEAIYKAQFTERVLARMNNVFARYRLMKLSPNEENMEKFKAICAESDPFNIVSDMSTYTDNIFLNKDPNKYDSNQFFALILMYLDVMNQFYIVQPQCSILVYNSSTPESMNITLMDGKKMIDQALKKKGINNLMSFSQNQAFLKYLFGTVDVDSDGCNYENVKKAFDVLNNTFYGIRQLFGEGFTFAVFTCSWAKVELHGDNVIAIDAWPMTVIRVPYPKIRSECDQCDSIKNGICDKYASDYDATYGAWSEALTEHCKVPQESMISYNGDPSFMSYDDEFNFCDVLCKRQGTSAYLATIFT